MIKVLVTLITAAVGIWHIGTGLSGSEQNFFWLFLQSPFSVLLIPVNDVPTRAFSLIGGLCCIISATMLYR